MEDFNKFLRKEAFKKSFGSLLESTENNSKLYENNIDFKFIKGEIIKDLKSDNVFIKSLKGEKGDRGEKGIDADNFRFGYGGDGALGYNQVVQEINNKLVSYYDKNEINQILLSAADIDLTGYYTKNEVDNLTSGFLENIVEDLSPELGNDLNANNHNISNLNAIQFNISATSADIPTTPGTLFWDIQDKTLSCKLNDATLQIGQELYIACLNKTSATIVNGSVVYINGAQGNRPTIELASNLNYDSAIKMIGVVTEDILVNSEGMVTTFGLVRDLNTKDYTDGDIIYLSSAAGTFTNIKPPINYPRIKVGRVIKSHVTDGWIGVNISHDKYMFGDVNNGNYSLFEDDGTLVFKGNATVYNDVYMQIASGKSPSVNFPTWTAFTTNTNAYQFAVNDNIDLSTTEIFHEWKEGSTIELHLHWATFGLESSAAYVKWRVYYTMAYDGTAFPDDLYLEKEVMISAGTPTRTSYMTSIGTIDMTGYPIGTQIKTKLARVSATLGRDPTLNPFAGMVGIHYEIDTIGSRNRSTK